MQKEVIMLEGTIVLDLYGDAASKFLRAPMDCSLGKAHDRGQSCLPLRVAASASREVPCRVRTDQVPSYRALYYNML